MLIKFRPYLIRGKVMNNKRIGLAGHAGVGHVHSHSGFVQDDSGGFATVGSIITEILGADTRVKAVDVDPDINVIKVTTVDGGIGISSPLRGITPREAELIKGVIGQDALFCQALAVRTLGRMYGQGVLETPVALEAALANSVVDTFHKKAPGRFNAAVESSETNSGLIGGMSTEDRSILITVNKSSCGLGPNEDLEGNVALGSKGDLMRKLGMLKCPTIIAEGKAYIPSLSDNLQQNTFLVRAQKDLDNMVVAQALYDSAIALHYPVILLNDVLPHREGAMRQNTIQLAKEIIKSAERLRNAERAAGKVLIVAELASLISQDAGAITFMSNKLHDVVRAVGMMPGTSAVLSILVTKAYREHWKIPLFDKEDVRMAKNIINLAMTEIASNIDEAVELVDRFYVSLDSLEQVIG